MIYGSNHVCKDFSPQGLLEFFEKFPAKEWTINVRFDHDTGRRCALGLLQYEPKQRETSRPEWRIGTDELSDLLRPLDAYTEKLGLHGYFESALASVNNGLEPAYPQKNPRARVIAFCKDLVRVEEESV